MTDRIRHPLSIFARLVLPSPAASTGSPVNMRALVIGRLSVTSIFSTTMSPLSVPISSRWSATQVEFTTIVGRSHHSEMSTKRLRDSFITPFREEVNQTLP